MQISGYEVDVKKVLTYIKKKVTYTFKIGEVYIALFTEEKGDEYVISAHMFGNQDKKKIVHHRCVIVDNVEIRDLFTKILNECPKLTINGPSQISA